MHFCFNSINDNVYPTQNATLSDSKVNIDYNGNTNIGGNLSIGNGLVYLPKSGNSTGTIKLGLGGTTGADDTTNMKIEINGVSNGTADDSGNNYFSFVSSFLDLVNSRSNFWP